MAEKVEKRHHSGRFQRFSRETVGELRKVTWPTTDEAWRLTKIVLMVLAIMAAILGTLDAVFSRLMTLILA